MPTTSGCITAEEIQAATSAMPDWLADRIDAWVRHEEVHGRRFTSAIEAVASALADMNRAE